MSRIVFDIKTGQQVVVPLTPEEEADAVSRTAAEQAEQTARAAEMEKASRQQKALEALPEILAYIAAKADAPASVKDKAAELEAVKPK